MLASEEDMHLSLPFKFGSHPHILLFLHHMYLITSCRSVPFMPVVTSKLNLLDFPLTTPALTFLLTDISFYSISFVLIPC